MLDIVGSPPFSLKRRAGDELKNFYFHHMNYALIRNYARQLRTNQTPAETFVWDKVRNRNFHGFKFTRQYIISFKLYTPNIQYFIVDFFCHEKKLILELDG